LIKNETALPSSGGAVQELLNYCLIISNLFGISLKLKRAVAVELQQGSVEQVLVTVLEQIGLCRNQAVLGFVELCYAGFAALIFGLYKVK
jgi:hypothetical protein